MDREFEISMFLHPTISLFAIFPSNHALKIPVNFDWLIREQSELTSVESSLTSIVPITPITGNAPLNTNFTLFAILVNDIFGNFVLSKMRRWLWGDV